MEIFSAGKRPLLKFLYDSLIQNVSSSTIDPIMLNICCNCLKVCGELYIKPVNSILHTHKYPSRVSILESEFEMCS